MSRRVLYDPTPTRIDQQVDALVNVTVSDIKQLIAEVYGGQPLSFERTPPDIDGPLPQSSSPPDSPRKPVLASIGPQGSVDLPFERLEAHVKQLNSKIAHG